MTKANNIALAPAENSLSSVVFAFGLLTRRLLKNKEIIRRSEKVPKQLKPTSHYVRVPFESIGRVNYTKVEGPLSKLLVGLFVLLKY